MAATRSRRRPSRPRIPTSVGKPRGVLHPRVQQVGPEHFGIVCFDCHKVSSKFLLADFYGRCLIPPTVVQHNRPDLDSAIAQIRLAFEQTTLSPRWRGRSQRPQSRRWAAKAIPSMLALQPHARRPDSRPIVEPWRKIDALAKFGRWAAHPCEQG